MKDRQIKRKAESSHIPVISPLLHVITMPVLVILRRNFGFHFLRPKSIFLSLCWAFGLFAIYSSKEPEKWSRNPVFFWFLCASVILYLFHLLRSFVVQYGKFGKAPHDQDAGKSWISFLSKDQQVVSLWIEPCLVLMIAVLLRFTLSPNHLCEFLFIAAFALFAKEAINQWSKLRKNKHQLDATEDAEEIMETVADERDAKPKNSVSKKTTRKSRTARKRAVAEPEKDVEYHAAILRMIPPYSVEQAEENFQKLVKQLHPDSAEDSEAENSDAITKLSDAREFFREQMEG